MKAKFPTLAKASPAEAPPPSDRSPTSGCHIEEEQKGDLAPPSTLPPLSGQSRDFNVQPALRKYPKNFQLYPCKLPLPLFCFSIKYFADKKEKKKRGLKKSAMWREVKSRQQVDGSERAPSTLHGARLVKSRRRGCLEPGVGASGVFFLLEGVRGRSCVKLAEVAAVG